MNNEKSHGETDTVTKGWATIIFIQGEEASMLLHTLLRFDGVVTYQGATEESVAEVLAELQRYEDGEWFDVYTEKPWGPADGTFEEGDYVIAYNSHVGYISLNMKVGGE